VFGDYIDAGKEEISSSIIFSGDFALTKWLAIKTPLAPQIKAFLTSSPLFIPAPTIKG
jgi:hypothetical protein